MHRVFGVVKDKVVSLERSVAHSDVVLLLPRKLSALADSRQAGSSCPSSLGVNSWFKDCSVDVLVGGKAHLELVKKRRKKKIL